MLLKPKYVSRFRHVVAVLVRHGFADVIALLDLQRFLPGHAPGPATPEERQQLRARNLRTALEELGATYIKLGQLLSTRPDLLPGAYIDELSRLQDRVEPFPFPAVRQAIEEAYNRPLEQVFLRFDERPLASASLSQVHRALLPPADPPARPGAAPAATGAVLPPPRDVAVKVLRPGIEAEVEVDLEILVEVGRFAGRSTLGQRHDLPGLVDQLDRTLRAELDLTQEARNARHFQQAVAEFDRLRVPDVCHELATRRVYVAEYVAGSRLAELGPAWREPELANQLWRAYLQMMLVDGLFQCDPHPGNFLIDGERRVVLLDHGMVAHLARETQIQLLSLLLALVDRDGDEVAASCIEVGVPGEEFRERRFKAEIGAMVARYAGLPLSEMQLGGIFVELVRTAHGHDIRIPSELMLFGKTLLNLDGVCQILDPEMDPVSVMRSSARTLMGRQLGRELTGTKALAAVLEARSLLTQVPSSVRRILRRAAANDLRIGLRLEGANELQASIQKIASRITLGLITASLIIGSALLLNVRAGFSLWGYPVFALVGFLLAAGLGIYLVAKIILADKY